MQLNRFSRTLRRYLGAALVLMAVIVVGTNANADQSDPRLDGLFDQLQDADYPAQAKRAEREIWTIWHETPDEQALEIMRAARTALDAGEISNSIALLDRLIKHAPDYAEAWNQRAIVRYLANDFDGSLHDIEQTLSLEPRHFGALSGRGQVYLQLEDHGRALEAFESALERNPWMDNIKGQTQMLRAILNAKPKSI